MKRVIAMASYSLPETLSSDHSVDEQSDQQTHEDIATCLDSNMYHCAVQGQLDAFEENKDHLHRLLTPNKNTILHIHITSAATPANNTDFADRILHMCPALLLQANAKGEIPLHLAARYGHKSMVELLIKHARISACDLERGHRHDPEEVVRGMLRTANKEMDTPLHEAVRFNRIGVVEIWSKEDPDFSHPANDAGETPLYLAAERGYRDLVTTILDNYSSPAYGGPCGRTALHAATTAEDEEIVEKILVKMGHLARQADNIGLTPLHLSACCDAKISMIRLLLKFDKYAAYVKDQIGSTALHIAAYADYDEMLKEILGSCFDCCELVDNRGWNVLHCAVKSKSTRTIKLLLSYPTLHYLLNEKDVNGNTPLHIAALSGRMRTVSYLLSQCGADLMAFNKENQNAHDVASLRVLYKHGVLSSLRGRGVREGNRVTKTRSNDGVLNDLQKEFDEEVISRINKGKEASLIVATLIATVTFAAGFTMPGGYVSDAGPLQGAAIMRKNSAFKAFVISDTIALFLSCSAVFIHFYGTRQPDESRMITHFTLAYELTTLAMVAMVVAFIAGTYSTLADSTALAISTCVIGSYFFLFVSLTMKEAYVSQRR